MATLTVTASHNYISESLGSSPIDHIVFAASTDAFVDFDDSQFGTGNGLIANNVLITGDSHQNEISVFISGTFSADAWQFTSWSPASDVLALDGDSGSDTITGSSQNDQIEGLEGADTLNGGGGNDTFRYLAGDLVAGEQVNGGSGTDTLEVNGVYDFTVVSLSSIEAVEFEVSVGTSSATFLDTQFEGKITTVKITTFPGATSNFTNTVIVNCTDGIVDLSSLTLVNWDDTQDSITINGTAGQDLLVGTSHNDTLNGGGNNDLLQGGLGDDTLDGGAGNDGLNGANGADTMRGGTGDDTYVVDNAGDVVSESGGDGIDTVQSTITFDLSANFENLTLLGSADIDGVGTSANNVMTGNSGSNSLDGGGGNDTLDGGAGADTLIGDIGNDIYVVDNAGDVVTEIANAGTDEVRTSLTNYTLGTNVENLTGTLNTGQTLTGNSLVNIITGGGGNDTLNGAAGADTMIGGAGNDTYTVDNAGDVVTENLNQGTDEVRTGLATYTLGANVENLTGTAAGAQTLTGNSLDNTISGSSAADVMAGGAGNDTYALFNSGQSVTENANEGADTVSASINYALGANVENLTLTGSADLQGYGNTVANTLNGNSGNNLLDGAAGADTMAGAGGNDVYFVDNDGDQALENSNQGNDSVFSSVSFTLAANVENLILQGSADLQGYGNGGANVLNGNSGNNLLNGFAGVDLMVGGVGDDVYFADDPSDACFEVANQGNDSVFATCSYGLAADVEGLILQGSGDFQAYGNNQANTIYGNSGNNLINAGGGIDLMAGGLGDDVYFADDPSDACFEVANQGNDSVFATCSYGLAADVENLILQGSGDFQAYGSSQANTIYGNAGSNLINGGGSADFMAGGAGNDVYFVDNAGDGILENANEGNDSVFASVSSALSANVEGLVLQGAANIDGTGNAIANVIAGNTGNNTLDGGGGADQLTGNAGNDIFVFRPGQANGDVVVDFAGNGVAAGDALRFIGYGAGATFTNIDATHWQVNYNGGSSHDIITFANGAPIDPTDYTFI